MAQEADIQTTAAGLEPEKVVVLETRGRWADFARAVRDIDGIEWLADWEGGEYEPDDDYFMTDQNGHRTDDPVQGNLYLSINNQQGIDQLLALWQLWQEQGPSATFPRGQAQLKQVFQCLKDLRRWDARDRIAETGVVEDLEERLRQADRPTRFEAELWFRENPNTRARAEASFISSLGLVGGRCLTSAQIPEIRYHAILAEIPREVAQNLVAGVEEMTQLAATHLFKIEHVMFYRPVGQCGCPAPEQLDMDSPSELTDQPAAAGAPIVALLDGLPLAHHQLLDGRLIIDDPDDIASAYEAGDQHHGTAMASLIIHGELDERNPPLGQKLYVRPIMAPDADALSRGEHIPEDQLPVDITWRAIRRIVHGDGGEPPVAPAVKIVNLSIGDSANLFVRGVSPWARMIDWLAYHHGLLFLISAGNHPERVDISVSSTDFRSLDVDNRQKLIRECLDRTVHLRRLMAPAEAVNAVTVAASHEDQSAFTESDEMIDAVDAGSPSPYNAMGLGFGRAIKPDLMFPGGRLCYHVNRSAHDAVSLVPSISIVRPPGQRVAHPGRAGELTSATYTRGTSNAAALATRACAGIYEVLCNLVSEPGGQLIEEKHLAALIKTLLCHGASWGAAYERLKAALRPTMQHGEFRRYAARYLGYGAVDLARCTSCDTHRATLVGCGELVPGANGSAHIYRVPLPPSLSAATIRRRLVVTLGWLAPLNLQNRSYRGASLYFTLPTETLQVVRQEADSKAVLRGTIQHEIFLGDAAVPIADDQTLDIKVNARSLTGRKVDDAVPYALAVSLEVAEELGIDIYAEVRQQIRPPVGVRIGDLAIE
ncbi:S8 family peptidase [Verrucomicrobiota bacterium]